MQLKRIIVLCLVTAVAVVVKKSTKLNIIKGYDEEGKKFLEVSIQIGSKK